MRFFILAAIMLLTSTVLQAQKHPIVAAEGAFSANFNAKPQVQEITRKTEEGINITIHMYITTEGNASTFVMYNEFEPGFNIEDDSIYLDGVAVEMMDRMLSIAGTKVEKSDVREIMFDGYPARAMDFQSANDIGEMKVILRSNRAYFVGAVFPKNQKSDLEKFTSSFKFLPFKSPSWTSHTFGNLKIDLPSPPVSEDHESLGEGKELYYSADLMSGDCYSVMIDQYSKYASFKNDSAILEERILGFRSGDENLNFVRDLTIDGRPAKELIVKVTENIVRRYLVFTYGNTGYTLITTLHPFHSKGATSQHFFASGKFTGKAEGNLLSDKSSLLLKDLTSSSDTAIVRVAKEEMLSYPFNEASRVEIMKLLERNYDDDSDSSGSCKELLLDALATIADESTVPFLEKLFPALKKNVVQEYSAIAAISKVKSREALDARIRLIFQHVSSKDLMYHPILGIYTVDSVDQRYFYDKIIPLLKNKHYTLNLYYLMNHLLQQKRLAQSDIASLKPIILGDFNSHVMTYKQDSTYTSLDDLIEILSYFDKPDAKTITQLKELSKGYDTNIGILASATLLKHKQSVDSKLLEKLAKDPYDRITLYNKFESLALLNSFPKKYLNQDSLTIAQAYTYLEEDFIPEKIEVVYEGMEDHGGKKKKFYVLRIRDEEGSWYRGVFGPFDPAKLSTWGDLNYVEYEEEPDTDYRGFVRRTIAAQSE